MQAPRIIHLGGDTAIEAALDDCIRHAQHEGIGLQEALDRLGPSSFCFVALLLSVPFIQPLSLGPLTIASGLTFIAAGWQMAAGCQTPTLPKHIRGARIHGKAWLALLRLCQRALRFSRKFTRTRLGNWVTGPRGARVVGSLICAGGVLLAIPAANLPFNNTFPALMILCASLAWLERDGALILVSLAWGAASILYLAAVAVAFWIFGAGLLDWFVREWGS